MKSNDKKVKAAKAKTGGVRGRPNGTGSVMVSIETLRSLGVTDVPVNFRVTRALNVTGESFTASTKNIENYVAKFRAPVAPVTNEVAA